MGVDVKLPPPGREVKPAWPCVLVGGLGAAYSRERRNHRALSTLACGQSPLVALGDWCCWWDTGTCAGGVRRPQHVPALCFIQGLRALPGMTFSVSIPLSFLRSVGFGWRVCPLCTILPHGGRRTCSYKRGNRSMVLVAMACELE